MQKFDKPVQTTTHVFSDEEGLAVYIPDEIAYPEGTELTILRSGDVITIYPINGQAQAGSGKSSTGSDEQ